VIAACLFLVSAQAAAGEAPPAPPPAYPPPPSAQAQPPPPGYVYAPLHGPGYRKHDGLFMRFVLGGGWLGMSESSGASELKASGTGSGMGAALGLAVVENLIVFVEASIFTAQNSDVTLNGAAIAGGVAALSFSGFGPGIAYYLEPTNVFFSGTIVFSELDLLADNGTLVTKTRRGIGLSAMAGKEWWISTNWALGLALQLQYGRMQDWAPDPSPVVGAGGISLLGTATFN
jgi:hypothetical protein